MARRGLAWDVFRSSGVWVPVYPIWSFGSSVGMYTNRGKSVDSFRTESIAVNEPKYCKNRHVMLYTVSFLTALLTSQVVRRSYAKCACRRASRLMAIVLSGRPYRKYRVYNFQSFVWLWYICCPIVACTSIAPE